MFTSWTSRVAVLSLTTAGACGVIALSPTLWSQDVIPSAEADPVDSDCTSAGGELVDLTGSIDFDDVFWAADTDGDGSYHTTVCACSNNGPGNGDDDACYTDSPTTSSSEAPGDWDIPLSISDSGEQTAAAATLSDCDDSEATVYIGAEDICDGLDNDCDGTVDNNWEVAPWFIDADGDGYGTIASGNAILACASMMGPPADGLSRRAGDCDDADPTAYPGADGIALDCINTDELCNGIDDDGDGTVDNGWPTTTWYADADGDGFGDNTITLTACEWGPIEGYVTDNTDCDDTDSTAVPGSETADNGLDEGCDDTGDGTADYRQDLDGDGYYDSSVTAIARGSSQTAEDALAELGWFPEGSLTAGDCDDTEPLMNEGMNEIFNDGLDNDCDAGASTADDGTGVTETCDGFDNDGDGLIDEDGVTDTPNALAVAYYADLDMDGQGDPNVAIACAVAPSYPVVDILDPNSDADCFDRDPNVYFSTSIDEVCGVTGTGDGLDNNCDGDIDGGYATNTTYTFTAQAEVCDALDNNCDGTVDENLTTGSFVADHDHDGAGDINASLESFCAAAAPVEHYVAYIDDQTSRNDCDDTDDSSALTQAYYPDTDGDSEGDANAAAVYTCNPTGNLVDNNDDCDDAVAAKNSAAPEVCDGVDNNCDGNRDNGISGVTPVAYYLDNDDDEYGAEGSAAVYTACPATISDAFYAAVTSPADLGGLNYSQVNTDCNDSGVDVPAAGSDPDVPSSSINPGANDDPYDDVDADCGDDNDYDADGDGYVSIAEVETDFGTIANFTANGGSTSNDVDPLPVTDCDDSSASFNPNATDTVGNGLDENCDLVDGVDADGDGFANIASGGTDCLDTGMLNGFAANEVFPGILAQESGNNNFDDPYDDVDENCDQKNDFDYDGDGHVSDAFVSDGACPDDNDPSDVYDCSHSYACTGLFGDLGDGTSCVASLPADDCDDNPVDNPNNCQAAANQTCADDVFAGNTFDPASNGVDNNCDGVPGIDGDGDGIAVDAAIPDCDDGDAQTYPGAPEVCGDNKDQDCGGNGDIGTAEICDGLDNDCNGTIDDGFATTNFYTDFDGDGYGDASDTNPVNACVTATIPGKAPAGGDCDDIDPEVNPGELEVCGDNKDNDCDGATDAGGGVEIVCNGIDDNCNFVIDEGAPQTASFFVDADGDGYGDSNSTPVTACQFAEVVGRSRTGGDCDDADPTINPGATEIAGDGINQDCNFTTADKSAVEICDGLDNDGVNGIDNGLPRVTFYVDADGDGYGDPAVPYQSDTDGNGTPDSAVQLCIDAVIAGAANNGDDCDDTRASVNPGAFEVCGDGLDNDCAGGADTGVEVCNGVNDDCDGQIDEGFERVAWYSDRDGDGFGDVADGQAIQACAEADPSNFSPFPQAKNRLDCDDFNANINPDAIEVMEYDASGVPLPYTDQVDNNCDTSKGDSAPDVCDGIDNDGDGEIDEDGGVTRVTFYEDLDGDGYGDTSGSFVMACPGVSVPGYGEFVAGQRAADCNDLDPRVFPGATEICADGVDTDCDGHNGGAQEGETCDGIDNDCDGQVDEFLTQVSFYVDADGDGSGTGTGELFCQDAVIEGWTTVNGDCDDRVASVGALQAEVCGDGVDNDCAGGADTGTEICNGIDDDCNGLTDDTLDDTVTYYADVDGDGEGDADAPVTACPDETTGLVPGYVDNSDDCDDSLATVNTSAQEVCNSADDNCDGATDDSQALATESAEWYLDADGDGFGRTSVTASCDELLQFQGYTRDNRDCQDAQAVQGQEVRNNAGEFYSAPRPSKFVQPEDIHPNATEVWYDGVDQDCVETFQGLTGLFRDFDQDGDGQICDGSATWPEPLCPPDVNGVDCVDGGTVDTVGGGSIAAADIFFDDSLGAIDTPYDGVNQNCRLDDDENVADDFDQDGDGYSDSAEVSDAVNSGYVYDETKRPAPEDCDDTDAFISPDAFEVCANNIDENCDGNTNEFGQVDPQDSNSYRYYPDADDDDYGDMDLPSFACEAPVETSSAYQGRLDLPTSVRYIVRGRDCDDTDEDIKPGGVEVWYSGEIENCDTPNDFDQDGDGFASETEVAAFFDPSGTLNNNQLTAAYEAHVLARDWDLLDPTDCFDNVDEIADAYPALDAAGQDFTGVPEVSFPGRSNEECDLIDNDCDGIDDEPNQLTYQLYYPDQDGDGFGDENAVETTTPLNPQPDEAVEDCRAPSSAYVLDNSDCLDDGVLPIPASADFITADLVNPEIDDLTYDGAVQSCLDVNDFDKDSDGWASTAGVEAFGETNYANLYNEGSPLWVPVGDCNDDPSDPNAHLINPDYVNPNAAPGAFTGDMLGDGVDSNCDGIDGVDADGDRVASLESGGNDCYDVKDGDIDGIPSEEIYGAGRNNNPPAHAETWYDDVDQNCDGKNDFDKDGDLFASEAKVVEFGISRPAWNYVDNSRSYALRNIPATDCEDAEVLVDTPNGAGGLYRTAAGVVASPVAQIPSANIRPNTVDTFYDGIDQDCDGADDFDQDEDTFADAASVELYNDLASPANDPQDLYGTYVGVATDCNDEDAAINSAAADTVANGRDNNCDGVPGVDNDGDLVASIASGGEDCNDNNAAVYPTFQYTSSEGVTIEVVAFEVCETGGIAQVDSDCDGNPNTSNEEYARNPSGLLSDGQTVITGLLSTAYYLDGDGDGYGDASSTTDPFYVCRLTELEGFAPNNSDCDDTSESINPAADEVCNSQDDNCDGRVNEPVRGGGSLTGTIPMYLDGDGDGYGTSDPEAEVLYVCEQYLTEIAATIPTDRTGCASPEMVPEDQGLQFPSSSGTCWSQFNSDCNDSAGAIYPRTGEDKFELFDGRDNDCDGAMPIIELDCDNDGQMPLLPIPAGPNRSEGVWTDPINTVFDLNCDSGADLAIDGVCDGVPDETASYGLQPCYEEVVTDDGSGNLVTSKVVNEVPRVRCLGGFQNLTCDLNTGFWTANLGGLDEEFIVDAIREAGPEDGNCDDVGDCDDAAEYRCAGRAERCDGIDNNCENATSLGVHLDADRNGIPDHMDLDAVTPGWVYAHEIDYDGDNQLECEFDARVSQDEQDVTLRGGDRLETPGSDCNNQCALLGPDAEPTTCSGMVGNSCPDTMIFGTDADNDDYRSCGSYGDDDVDIPDESIFALTFAQQTVAPSDFEDEQWNVVPLVMPRAKANGTDPVECDVSQWEALNELIGVENVLTDATMADLLGVCVEIDNCREYRRRDPDSSTWPAYCADYDLTVTRCVVTEMTINREADVGIFDEEYPGCLEQDGSSWYPEQVVTRSVWSADRIVEARRLVVEWDCYRHNGEFGCGGDGALEVPEGLELFNYGYPQAGGFNAGDRSWRTLDTANLTGDADVDLMFNRFDPTAETSGLLYGCWGDPTRGGVEQVRRFAEVGGDCDDSTIDANRGGYEGPDDLLALFDGVQTECDVCSDGIDNNCNGRIDRDEPACARCFIGQSAGCGCSASGSPAGALGGGMVLLLLGLALRRRRDGEEA